MKQTIIAILSFLSFSAFAQETTITDANAQARTLDGSFTSITVSDGIDLYLTQGTTESVAVSASEQKYLDRLKTVVENNVLKLYYDTKGIHWTGNEKKKLTVYVSFKTLSKLQGSSGADVHLQGKMDVSDMEMKFTGGSRFTGEVTARSMEVEQNSGAEVNISGKAEKIRIAASSGAIFKGYDLAVDFCDAKASSGAGIRITINKELNAIANSGGGIRFKGEGLIRDMNVNSGGIVKRG